MALIRTTNGIGSSSNRLARDPYSIARELLNWDPFFTARPASAFAPAFEVKETNDSFVLRVSRTGLPDQR